MASVFMNFNRLTFILMNLMETYANEYNWTICNRVIYLTFEWRSDLLADWLNIQAALLPQRAQRVRCA